MLRLKLVTTTVSLKDLAMYSGLMEMTMMVWHVKRCPRTHDVVWLSSTRVFAKIALE
jgi:hypothetical protein